MARDEAVRLIEQTAEKSLTKLDLSGLELEEWPPEIAKCTSLTELNLSNNQITSIPEDLQLMSNLEWLDLGRNQITFIPATIGQLSNLKGVNLSNNQITSIPEAIGHLSNLECLLLNENRITLIRKNELSQLSDLKLAWLNISGNPTIKVDINPGSSGFPTSIGKMQKLKVDDVYKDGTYSHSAYHLPQPPNGWKL